MKVKSIKSIYLTKGELKDAVKMWLRAHGHSALERHLKGHGCEFEWSHEDDGVYLAVDMDGTFEEKEE